MNNKWLSLNISTKKDNLEIVSSYFDLYTIGSHIEDSSMTMYFLFNDKNKVEDILSNIKSNYNIEYDWGSVESQNWMNNWKVFFQPVNIKDKVIIIPDWDTNDYSQEYMIKICPAMAFGTGHHASTQLVIEQMLNFNIGNYDTLLDLGAGSGILSILAKKMGVDTITPIDIDPVCEDNFYQNCKLSNINKIDFIISDVHKYNNYNHDVILANIDKKNIINILDKYQKSDSRALLILAGLLESDLDDVKSCLKECNIDNVLQQDEWISLAIKKYDK